MPASSSPRQVVETVQQTINQDLRGDVSHIYGRDFVTEQTSARLVAARIEKRVYHTELVIVEATGQLPATLDAVHGRTDGGAS